MTTGEKTVAVYEQLVRYTAGREREEVEQEQAMDVAERIVTMLEEE